MMLFLAALYCAPTFVALAVHRRNLLGIATLNLLLGWSIVGWAAALIWALAGHSDQPATAATVIPADYVAPRHRPTAAQIAVGTLLIGGSIVATMLAASCGGTSDKAATCVTGQQVTCGCPNDTTSTQTCGPDGTYGACGCPSSSSSSSGGSSTTNWTNCGAPGAACTAGNQCCTGDCADQLCT